MLPKTAEYALRVIVQLAENYCQDNPPMAAPRIAELTQVPRRYIHRVLDRLIQGGFVESRLGASGGYLLIKDPSQITILDVVNAVERMQRIHECPLGLPTHQTLCPLHAELDRAYESAESALGRVTIQGLLDSRDSAGHFQ